MKIAFLLAALLTAWPLHAAAWRALLIDGQNNHDYKSTTPHLKKVLEEHKKSKDELSTKLMSLRTQ